MTKITVICNDSDYFLRHRLAVVERLVAAGADVTVITGGNDIAGRVPAEWRYQHLPIERFSFHPFLDLRVFYQSLRNFLAERPAAVHLITLKPAVLSGLAALHARLLCGKPKRILITLPGLGRLMSPSSPRHRPADRMARCLVDTVIRLLSSRSGVHFTFENSDDRNDWLKRGLIRETNSTVVSGAGVDPNRFHPADNTRSPPPIRVLFASRLLKSKGLDSFVQAARHFSRNNSIDFVVAGMVEENDPDRYPPELLQNEPAIEFLGEVSAMPELLRSVDLVCLPSRYGEGIPRILIEAAASGVACLATDFQGCREIVRDGENGTLIPAGNAHDMASGIISAIDRYYSDPKLLRQEGCAGLKLFRSGQFREDAVTREFIRLLMNVADGTPGAASSATSSPQ